MLKLDVKPTLFRHQQDFHFQPKYNVCIMLEVDLKPTLSFDINPIFILNRNLRVPNVQVQSLSDVTLMSSAPWECFDNHMNFYSTPYQRATIKFFLTLTDCNVWSCI